MNWERSFVRKIGYLVAIVLLLLLLVLLGQPATSAVGERPGSRGGLLAQIRADHGICEAQLGEIDPTSETIKLATLGMRGIAANVLWDRAMDYKMKKDWTNLSAALRQIAMLEPHYIQVWRYQGWNLSYNVSVEFDDYRERYRWVIRGIDYLMDGIRYNQKEPMLFRDVGWFISHKIGIADEWKQFRRLFRQDDDFFRRINDTRSLEERDNWLVGSQWFGRGETLVDEGADMRRVSPVLFYSWGPMCLMSYAEALEKDGVFEEKARIAWESAGKRWLAFGERAISIGPPHGLIRLNEKERLLEEADRRVEELEKLAPKVRDTIRAERRAQLTDAERIALDTPPEQRKTVEVNEAAYQAEMKMLITHEQVARRVTGPNVQKAMQVALEANRLIERASLVNQMRGVIAFEWWRRRAWMEQLPETLAARKLLYQGDEAIAKGDLVRAKEMFDKSFQQWRLVLDRKEWPKEWPGVKTDTTLARELVEAIQRYRRVLEKRDEPFPAKFILQDVLTLNPELDEKPSSKPPPAPPGLPGQTPAK